MITDESTAPLSVDGLFVLIFGERPKKEDRRRHGPRKCFIPIGPSIAYVQLTQGKVALIDSDDVSKVSAHNWCALWSKLTNDYYAGTNMPKSDGRRSYTLRLHNAILPPPANMTTDHKIPGNALDCRKANLRHADRCMQSQNRRKQRSNTSGHVGVSLDKTCGFWGASIYVNGKSLYLGKSKILSVAIAIRKDGERKYRGIA